MALDNYGRYTLWYNEFTNSTLGWMSQFLNASYDHHMSVEFMGADENWCLSSYQPVALNFTRLLVNWLNTLPNLPPYQRSCSRMIQCYILIN